MPNITVYVNRNTLVPRYDVSLTDVHGGATVVLTTKNFKPYTGADPAHTGDEVAVVDPFDASPKFHGRLHIDTAGGGRAEASFDVNGQPLGSHKMLFANFNEPVGEEDFFA